MIDSGRKREGFEKVWSWIRNWEFEEDLREERRRRRREEREEDEEVGGEEEEDEDEEWEEEEWEEGKEQRNGEERERLLAVLLDYVFKRESLPLLQTCPRVDDPRL